MPGMKCVCLFSSFQMYRTHSRNGRWNDAMRRWDSSPIETGCINIILYINLLSFDSWKRTKKWFASEREKDSSGHWEKWFSCVVPYASVTCGWDGVIMWWRDNLKCECCSGGSESHRINIYVHTYTYSHIYYICSKQFDGVKSMSIKYMVFFFFQRVFDVYWQGKYDGYPNATNSIELPDLADNICSIW